MTKSKISTKLSHQTLGLIQAAGLVLYVLVFALCAQHASDWLRSSNIQIAQASGIIIFLLLFIISALICVSIVFAYPLTLFLANKKKEALKTVLWTGIWLVVLFAAFALTTLGLS